MYKNKFIVMSPCYELLRYGHDKIKNQTIDAHTIGKLSKFIIGHRDLINPNLPPNITNFRFETCQYDHADIVIFVDKNQQSTILKGSEYCEDK
jgi:hypothetical protein